MRWILTAVILVIALVGFAGPAESGLYKWTDEDGNLHVATSIEDVPERYRSQVATMDDDPAPRPAAAPEPAPASAPAEEPAAADASELPSFQVPYENEGTAGRVIIQVRFNDRLTAPMALDTGSPGLVISVELADRLGVFSRDSGVLFTAAAGIGGEALAIRTIVNTVSVEKARSEFVPTTITDRISTAFDGLIGMDFLSNHTISIDTRNQVVVFQEIPPLPGARGGHDEAWWRNTFDDFRTVRDFWDDLSRKTNLRDGSPYKTAIEYQARESQRLYLRLDRYAGEHAVPRHWR